MRETIRVSVVDDDQGIVVSLAAIFGVIEGYDIVSTYTDSRKALKKLPDDQPDVVLMDICMPQPDGIECTQRIMRQSPDIRVIIITGNTDPKLLAKAIVCGACGYLLKPFKPEEVVESMRRNRRREFTFDDRLLKMLRVSLEPTTCQCKNFGFTLREEEIAELLSQGLSNCEIGKELNICLDTIKFHLKKMYRKAGVRGRGEMMAALTSR